MNDDVDLELHHLRTFAAVAEELHFRRAAERLHLSQPAVSEHIRRLEEILGVSLLRRSNRRVELTTAGALFRDRARELLELSAGAVRDARLADRGHAGSLTVGVAPGG